VTGIPGHGARSAATIAFDRLAADYDALTGGEIFALLRRRTHNAFARYFSAGSRVLEIGCGTGRDTCFLASRGIRVIACDPSEEMASRALRRLAHERLEDRATVMPCGLQDVQAFLEATGEPEAFDGIVSNFGALNCVQHLSPLRALIRRYLKPGGVVALGLMTRLCALEALYFAATRRSNLAIRRLGAGAVSVPVAGVDVPTFYHRINAVRATLGHDVILCDIEGIGVAIPPPYLESRWLALPTRVRSAVTRLDALIAPWPPFNRLGDHVLLHFVKDGTLG
jgi:SAM-dependent methyltransferase